MDFQKYNIKEKKKKKRKERKKQTKQTNKQKTKPQELLKIIIREIDYLKM